MTLKQFDLVLFVALIPAALAAEPAASATKRPNLILMLADDLGHGDLGVTGSKQIPTPHIDSLAANGVRFTSAYVASATWPKGSAYGPFDPYPPIASSGKTCFMAHDLPATRTAVNENREVSWPCRSSIRGLPPAVSGCGINLASMTCDGVHVFGMYQKAPLREAHQCCCSWQRHRERQS